MRDAADVNPARAVALNNVCVARSETARDWRPLTFNVLPSWTERRVRTGPGNWEYPSVDEA